MSRTARGLALALVATLGSGSLAASAPGAVAAPPAAQVPTGPTFVQACGGTSWWAGSTNVCDGTLVYRDYVYDDAGADEGDLGYGRGTQNAYGTLAHPAGDVRYPADPITTADLVQLTLTRVGDTVEVVAELNALYAPDSTILALAVDSDGDPATGGGDWDRASACAAPAGTTCTPFDVGDPETNTIRGSFPLPAAPTFRVQAVTAQVRRPGHERRLPRRRRGRVVPDRLRPGVAVPDRRARARGSRTPRRPRSRTATSARSAST